MVFSKKKHCPPKKEENRSQLIASSPNQFFLHKTKRKAKRCQQIPFPRMLFLNHAVHKAEVQQVKELGVVCNLVHCRLRNKTATGKGDSAVSGIFQAFQEPFLPHNPHPANHKIWVDAHDFLDFGIDFMLVGKVAVAEPDKVQLGVVFAEYGDRPFHFVLLAGHDVDALAVDFGVAEEFRGERGHVEAAALDVFAVEPLDGYGQELAVDKNPVEFREKIPVLEGVQVRDRIEEGVDFPPVLEHFRVARVRRDYLLDQD